MAESSTTLHEQGLRPETVDRHRAIASIMEELEAVDWYDQRVEAASDPELRELLAHNRDEEKEHAAMVLEWLRRRDPGLDENLRKFLFKSGPIRNPSDHDEGGEGGGNTHPTSDGSLGIGSLKGR